MRRGSHKQRVFWNVLALLIALISLPVWLTYRAVQQEQRNQALMAAIKRSDAKAVCVLLASGADPKARDEPRRPLSFWQALLQLFPGRHHPPSQALTALHVAVQQDLSGTRPEQQEANRLIVQSLLERGATEPQTQRQ